MRYAIRQLIKSPGFTVVALITLALGIGVNATIYSLVSALLYRMPPFQDPSRLVSVFATSPSGQYGALAPGDARDILQQNTVFEKASIFSYFASNLGKAGEPAERVPGQTVGGNFFSTLGVEPIQGRYLTPADDRLGHSDVVVIGERFWRERLAAKPDAVGTTLRLDGRPVTVVGVMPASFADLPWGPAKIWQPAAYDTPTWSRRDTSWLRLAARLKPGVTVAQAQAELNTIAKRLAHDFPKTNFQTGFHAELYSQARLPGAAQQLWFLMGLMLSVLLIACINLANLQLARTAGRAHEYAVRIALGASRGQLVLQLLTECVLLSLAGGVLGVLVASWGNDFLGKGIPIGGFDETLALRMDARVLGFTLIASIATGIVFGLMPAWNASRADVNLALKQNSRGTGDRSKHRLRSLLVIGELALTLALLSGAGFFLKGIQKATRTPADLGWHDDHLLTGSFMLPYTTYKNDDQLRSGVDRITSRLAELPGVDHVAVAGGVAAPIFGLSMSSDFLIQGQAPPARGKAPNADTERATPGYFSTMGIGLLSGRLFTTADRADSRQVAIINQAMAQKIWPHGDAIGHRIGGTDPAKPGWREIIGIVNDVKFPGRPSIPATNFQVYHPFAQDPEHWLGFAIHSNGSPEALADAAKRAVARADQDLAVSDVQTVEGYLKRARSTSLSVGTILFFAALLGLLLSLVGIYGVIANLAAQRTREIGIHMALGAQSKAVLWLFLRNGVCLAAIGVGIGLLLGFGLTWVLGLAMPYIEGKDPLQVAGLALLMVGATLLASWVPARRATLVNPVEALRAE